MSWVGYVGMSFLIIRLVPITYEQFTNKDSEINMPFLLLEAAASLFLGISAIMYEVYPFIIANLVSFLNVIVLIFINFYNKREEKDRNITEI